MNKYLIEYNIWNDPTAKGVKVDYWLAHEDGSKEWLATFEEANVGTVMEIIGRMNRCFSNYKFVRMES